MKALVLAITLGILAVGTVQAGGKVGGGMDGGRSGATVQGSKPGISAGNGSN